MKRSLLQECLHRYPGFTKDELYARVLCGEILIDGERCRDPKQTVTGDVRIDLEEQTGYVSRGGEKLEGALQSLEIDPSGDVWLDAGASTGGFTDCLLSHGARLVHAVDVGTNQLAWKLRTDERVLAREGTNIMDVTVLEPMPDRATADISFRSLRKAAIHVLRLTRKGDLLSLVKPQFEWLHPPDEFSGVVERREDIIAILDDLTADLASEGVGVLSAALSGITGRDGNREVFFHLTQSEGIGLEKTRELIRSIV